MPHFGAFVDIGVHQDGLVHVSQLAEPFVNDPREVVKAGDVVKVHALSRFDVQRKRIALTMKLDEVAPAARQPVGSVARGPVSPGRPAPRTDRVPTRPAAPATSLAAAFAVGKELDWAAAAPGCCGTCGGRGDMKNAKLADWRGETLERMRELIPRPIPT